MLYRGKNSDIVISVFKTNSALSPLQYKSVTPEGGVIVTLNGRFAVKKRDDQCYDITYHINSEQLEEFFVFVDFEPLGEVNRLKLVANCL